MYEYLWMQGELLHSVKNPLFERAINRQSRSEVQKAADNDPHRRGRSARIYHDLQYADNGPRQSGTGRHSKAEIFLASCGDFLFVYFVQINNMGDAEQDGGQRGESRIVRRVMKAVSAKINDACDKVDDPAHIAQQPQDQKRNVRHHGGIANALLSFPLELFDMGFRGFSFFVQDFLYRIYGRSRTSNSFFFVVSQSSANFNVMKTLLMLPDI